MAKEYAVIIIGGGPAGLSAGIYAGRAKLKTLLIEKGLPGGLLTNAEVIENYPGFPDGISGFELAELIQKQAAKFELEILNAEVKELELRERKKVIKTSRGDFSARTIIIAGGSERKKLGVPGEAEFTGKGVAYCSTCDAALFQDKPVAVIGGGSGAIYEALNLARYASMITVINSEDKLRAPQILQYRVSAEPKIKFLMNQKVASIEGGDTVEKLCLKHAVTRKKSVMEVAGVFIAIGQKPSTDYLKDTLLLDANGYIVTNEKMETNVPGIYAAGDIRSNSIRQSIAAAGDGAVAAIYAERFISG